VTDESLFREVDEEVRQDEYQKIWKRYGNLIMAVAAAVVLGFGGLKYWQYYQQTQAEQAASIYFDALQKAGQEKFEDATAALKSVAHPGYKSLARLQEAGILASQNKTEEALAAYDAIAADGSVEKVLQDVARIRAAYLLVDTVKPDALLSRISQYDVDTSPWRFQAREIFGLTAWRTGDYTMADRYMNALVADPKTPVGMRQRARMMVQLIAPRLATK
jgi:hypothetical protein